MMNTSSDYMQIVTLLRGNETERKEGVRLLFELPFIRQYAFYWYRRYLPRIKQKHPKWTDLYMETVLEFINEVDEGRGPRTNVKGYVSRLCQNLCEKALRELSVEAAFDAVIGELLKSGRWGSRLKDWVEKILDQMECKCRSLLRWRYMQVPPVKNPAELAALLNEECKPKRKDQREFSADAIPVHLHECRNKFRELAGYDPFDFENEMETTNP